MSMDLLISVVSPVYYGEHTIQQLTQEVTQYLKSLNVQFEIILVEDHSPDKSWEEIVYLTSIYRHVKGIKLSRNFGQQYAIQAGLDASCGDYIITMDCDLQDDPKEIITLYNEIKNNEYDIVYAQRYERKDSITKKFLSWIFYKILSYLSETKQDPSIANFVVYNRKVIDAIDKMNDYRRYYPMMSQWVGFNSKKIKLVHKERTDGIGSSYSLKKRINLAINTIISFSDKPLRLIIKFGLLIVLATFASGLYITFGYMKNQISVQGWTSLALLLSFFSGVIITTLGTIGLYVAHSFEKIKDRPSYIVDQRINF